MAKATMLGTKVARRVCAVQPMTLLPSPHFAIPHPMFPKRVVEGPHCDTEIVGAKTARVWGWVQFSG